MIGALAALLTLLLAAPAHAVTSERERWSFEPNVYDFGVWDPAAGPTPPKAFTLTNTGEVPLTAMYAGIQWGSGNGPDPEMFRIVYDDCETLEPGRSCTIEVVFDPSRPGPKQGVLTVADVEPSPRGATASAYFAGYGAGQIATLSTTLISFEPREAESGPTVSQIVTVTNEGQLDLTLSSIAVVRHDHFDDDQFRLAGGTCAAHVVLPPGGFCTVRVAFAPTAAHNFSADLRIEDNAPDSPQYATVEGVGLAPRRGPSRSGLRAFIVGRPKKVTTQRSASFSFKGSASAASFECRLDAHPFAPCASPARYGHLKAGSHSFGVRAIDASGRAGRAAAQYGWRVEPRH